jgi:hypothetical protein
MVIELVARRPPDQVATRPSVRHSWSDDAAYRLAAVVLADPVVVLSHSTNGVTVDSLATQLQPLVAWARRTPSLTDDDAVRRGVIAAGTRTLVGVPRRVTLVAFHELPATMRTEMPMPRRLDALTIEVGSRVRRQVRHPESPLRRSALQHNRNRRSQTRAAGS